MAAHDRDRPLDRHLAELRAYIMVYAIAFVLVFAVLFGTNLMGRLLPLQALSGAGIIAYYRSITFPIEFYLKLAATCAFALTLPIAAACVLLFVYPAMDRREKLFALYTLPIALPLSAVSAYVGATRILPGIYALCLNHVPQFVLTLEGAFTLMLLSVVPLSIGVGVIPISGLRAYQAARTGKRDRNNWILMALAFLLSDLSAYNLAFFGVCLLFGAAGILTGRMFGTWFSHRGWRQNE